MSTGCLLYTIKRMICQFSINLMKQIRINAYNVAVFVRQMGVNCFYSHFKWNIRFFILIIRIKLFVVRNCFIFI